MKQDIQDRLRSFPFFENFGDDALAAIADCCVWQSIAGGWQLIEQDETPDAIHFVLSGRLVAVQNDGDDQSEDVLGYIRAGEPVGEMAFLSNEAHTSAVYALRDTELLTIPRSHADVLLEEYGEFATALSRTVLSRLRAANEAARRTAPRVFALIAGSRSIDIRQIAAQLEARLTKLGVKVTTICDGDIDLDSNIFDRREAASTVVILAARVDGSDWYRFVLRHADRFLVFARRDAKPPRPFPLASKRGLSARRFRLVDLVIVEEGVQSASIDEWASAIDPLRMFHWRGGECLDRLARVIAGKSVGLVLSGGGARAYAHIGVVKALRAASIPVDFVSGASMGAVIAACVAAGWSDEEIERRVRDAFVNSNPLGDRTLPVVALTRGERVDARLAHHFADLEIEELALPFFCVSSDLTTGAARIHRRGLVRDALRASIAIPGILPPVVDGEALLVDGAVINNFPTDVMMRQHRGTTIGVDVARSGALDAAQFQDPPGMLGWIAEHGIAAAPPIVSLLMRAATIRPGHHAKKFNPEIMVTPSVDGVGLRDWTLFNDAVSNGQEAAALMIEQHRSDLPHTPIGV